MKLSISKEEINTLPLISFSGSIKLITSLEDHDCAIKTLQKEKTLGFDTETRPAYKKGERHDISLLQLSTSEQAFLFRLNHIPLTEKLQSLLSNQSIVKAGVAIRDDIKGLRRLNDFQPDGFVELADLAKELKLKNFGLRSLTALLLDKRVSKQNKLTNWEKTVLTPEQQRYAATDAWLSLKLYQRMTELKEDN